MILTDKISNAHRYAVIVLSACAVLTGLGIAAFAAGWSPVLVAVVEVVCGVATGGIFAARWAKSPRNAQREDEM